MSISLEAPPVLATPDTHVFEESNIPVEDGQRSRLSDDEVYITYEIERTIREIKQGRWQRIALQFPDDQLVDAPKVFEALSRGLKSQHYLEKGTVNGTDVDQAAPLTTSLEESIEQLHMSSGDSQREERLYILADTSYGACCVDEIAAEHVAADVVVHYGRACLSPTARLPVIYVFTHRPLPHDTVVLAFKEAFPDSAQNIIIMADVSYTDHLPNIYELLRAQGYSNLHVASIVRDPSSPLPNRTLPQSIQDDPGSLKDWQLFHIAEPSGSLLLTLSSRLAAIHIFPTAHSPSNPSPQSFLASTSMRLGRRFALATSLSTASIIGILINTLSVKNYLDMVQHVQAQILAAGKKSYTFVVGKVNVAKIANFSEVGGWVVIGCWESSLIESREFFVPLITPFELEIALKSDEERIWTGEWRGDFQGILDRANRQENTTQHVNGVTNQQVSESHEEDSIDDGVDLDSEPESMPPEFDLRTGRLVSHTRPMRAAMDRKLRSSSKSNGTTKTLIKRVNGDLASIGGEISPGAEFLRSNRTWKGLGSDFEIAYDEGGAAIQAPGALIEQGRSGIARGYTVDDGDSKR